MPQTKALRGLKITNADEGRVSALFATFNVKDHDGDVTLPDAFQDGEGVRISVYNHGSWGPGQLPVGKGVVRTTKDGPVLEGQFFLNTTAGADTFETVKQMGDLQEWSYGYDVLDSERGTKDGEKVRFLKKMKVHEVSPVLLGAGIGTQTLGVKGRGGKQLDSELRERIQAAGVDKLGGDNTRVWLVDFDVDGGTAIFAVATTSGEGGEPDCDYIRVPFLRGMNGDVVIGEGQEEVERNTEWVAAPPDGKSATPDGMKRAIPFKTTGTDSKARWTAGLFEKRIQGTDAQVETGMRAFSAWEDDTAEKPRSKSAFKFGHHIVNSDGDVGDASVRACITGIAILNGARGGTTIPDEDRKGVYNHLARHLKDAAIEDPPPLKARPDGEVKLTDHLEIVCADVEAVKTRLLDVAAQRAEKGKGLGDESQQSAEGLADELDQAVKSLREVLASAATTKSAPGSGLTLEDETRLAENRLRLSA